MRTVEYPCGCLNEVQPNTALKSVRKCAEHLSQRSLVTERAYYAAFGVVDEHDRLMPTNHVDELVEALGPIEPVSNKYALEVGAGVSPYFHKLVHSGYRYVGCDESSYACRVMRNNGAAMLYSRFEDAPLKRYDLILAMHVLEHVVDPVEMLRKIRVHLRPRGVVYIIVPSNEDPVNPDHLWVFNLTALRIMLTDVGLRIQKFNVRKRIERESFIYVKAIHDPDFVS